MTAYREAGRTVVLIPARFTRAQEREWVSRMLSRLSAQEKRRRPGDDELMARAQTLSDRHLRGLAQPATVTWVSNQNSRWGSCTPADRSIRLSTRLLGMPAWVLDYVLLHELAHLIQPGHGPNFWSLLDTYPRTERARGFLEGFAAARDLPVEADHHEVADSLDGTTDVLNSESDDANETEGDKAAEGDKKTEGDKGTERGRRAEGDEAADGPDDGSGAATNHPSGSDDADAPAGAVEASSPRLSQGSSA